MMNTSKKLNCSDQEQNCHTQQLFPATYIMYMLMAQRLFGSISLYVTFLFNVLTTNYSLQKRDRVIHIAVDGWTAPLVASYLGLVVIWYQDGKIYRAILEFIR